jgi:FKBP-type peptidyl-prolyl cis-trans isomerase FkpA
MKSVITLVLTLGAFLAQAQDSLGFKLTDRGTRYKIIAIGTGAPMAYGNFFEFSYEMHYKDAGKDSLLNSSEQASNSIAVLDTASTPAYIYNIFSQCRMGDSVVLQVPVDSAYVGGPLPDGFSKNGYFTSSYRIVNVYTDRTVADSVFQQLSKVAQLKAEAKARALAEADDNTIVNYLAVKGINAVKAPMGTYIETQALGKGNKIDANVEVGINYTGRTLAGKVFDSNTDPAFGHVEPISVKMWEPSVIQGWIEGLPYFSLGAKGRLYIPSGLGYGPQGAGSDIGPNEILIFDVEVVKITPKPMPPAPKLLKKAPAKKPVAKKAVKKAGKK